MEILTQSTMMEPMLEAYPEFRPTWEAFRQEFPVPIEENPTYILLGELACDCSALLREGRTDTLKAIFAVLERWITHGDRYCSDAAVVGLIEDLQNTNLHDGTSPEDYLPLLHPRSRREWDKVNDFWSKGKIITRD